MTLGKNMRKSRRRSGRRKRRKSRRMRGGGPPPPPSYNKAVMSSDLCKNKKVIFCREFFVRLDKLVEVFARKTLVPGKFSREDYNQEELKILFPSPPKRQQPKKLSKAEWEHLGGVWGKILSPNGGWARGQRPGFTHPLTYIAGWKPWDWHVAGKETEEERLRTAELQYQRGRIDGEMKRTLYSLRKLLRGVGWESSYSRETDTVQWELKSDESYDNLINFMLEWPKNLENFDKKHEGKLSKYWNTPAGGWLSQIPAVAVHQFFSGENEKCLTKEQKNNLETLETWLERRRLDYRPRGVCSGLNCLGESDPQRWWVMWKSLYPDFPTDHPLASAFDEDGKEKKAVPDEGGGRSRRKRRKSRKKTRRKSRRKSKKSRRRRRRR